MCALVGIEGIIFTVIATESEVSKIVGIIPPSENVAHTITRNEN